MAAVCLPIYRIFRLASGCFLFCTREAFDAVCGFDERLFAAEEGAMSRALARHGRFVVLREFVVTSGRKLRAYSPRGPTACSRGSPSVGRYPCGGVRASISGTANGGPTRIRSPTSRTTGLPHDRCGERRVRAAWRGPGSVLGRSFWRSCLSGSPKMALVGPRNGSSGGIGSSITLTPRFGRR